MTSAPRLAKESQQLLPFARPLLLCWRSSACALSSKFNPTVVPRHQFQGCGDFTNPAFPRRRLSFLHGEVATQAAYGRGGFLHKPAHRMQAATGGFALSGARAGPA